MAKPKLEELVRQLREEIKEEREEREVERDERRELLRELRDREPEQLTPASASARLSRAFTEGEDPETTRRRRRGMNVEGGP